MNITKDFEQVWLTPTPKGMKLIEGEGVGAPFHFRLQIDAADRDDWHIENVWIIDVEYLGAGRHREILVPLEGDFAKEVIRFFEQSDKFADDIQEKVNFEIIPPVRWDYHEAGRTM